MIDQTLITDSINHVKAALESRQPTLASNLSLLIDVLPSTMIDKIQQYISDVPAERWAILPAQENLPRRYISWDSDTVIEELHEVFLALTDEINRAHADIKKNFWGIALWKDQENYHISTHTDNPDIDTALQIYLFGNNGCPGTEFYLGDEKIMSEFGSNRGYLVSHTQHKLPHRTPHAVPQGAVRYSLYAIWSRLPKHVADT